MLLRSSHISIYIYYILRIYIHIYTHTLTVLLVCEASRYQCVRPQATSVWGLKIQRVSNLWSHASIQHTLLIYTHTHTHNQSFLLRTPTRMRSRACSNENLWFLSAVQLRNFLAQYIYMYKWIYIYIYKKRTNDRRMSTNYSLTNYSFIRTQSDPSPCSTFNPRPKASTHFFNRPSSRNRCLDEGTHRWCMLTYADVCWRMLYADVCWRMLT
jgi:hypothetical protein